MSGPIRPQFEPGARWGVAQLVLPISLVVACALALERIHSTLGWSALVFACVVTVLAYVLGPELIARERQSLKVAAKNHGRTSLFG